jgi:hypothetical protein
MALITTGSVVVPLSPQLSTYEVVPDGLEVVAAEVLEDQLAVRLHYVYDVGAPVMKRMIQAMPDGARASAVRHVWSVIRLGVAYHFMMEV